MSSGRKFPDLSGKDLPCLSAVSTGVQTDDPVCQFHTATSVALSEYLKSIEMGLW
jgi:hypothetical protein